ncbi:MAG: hypothetical protein ACLQOO_36210 [Terriglobia bacterium]
MMSQTPELEAIRQRLEKLERENRRLKRAGSLGLLVVAAGFLMAQGKYNRRIEAEEFVLTDAHGSERAQLEWKDQAPRFVLLDAQGKPQPAPGATVLAAKVGTGALPQGEINREAAPRELKDTSSGPHVAAKHARAERPRVVDLPGAPGLPLVASLADPSFEASTTEWDADAAALSVSNAPRPVATASPSDGPHSATLRPGPDGPLHATGEPQAASVTPLPVASRISQAAPTNAHRVEMVAQLEKPLDAGAAWPPTSVASVPPTDAPSATDANPGVLPPPIALKVMGYADKPGKGRELFIAQDSEVFVAHEGDLFADRFRVLKITAGEVEIEDETRRERFRLTFHP